MNYFKKLRIGLIGLLLMLLIVGCGDEANTATSVATTAAKTAPRLVATSGVTTEATTIVSPTATVATVSTATVAPTTAAPATTQAVTATTIPATTQAATTAVAATGPTIAPATDGKFSDVLAYGHVKELATNIGIRAAGSPNEIKAADYIENYFKRLNLQTSRPEVTFTNFEDKGSALNYQVGGSKIEVAGNAVNLSGAGNLSATLSYIGFGLDGQVTSGLKGKIALVQRGQITFAEKVERAESLGAVGIIIFNDRDGPLNTATLRKSATIPVIGITQKEGEKLRQDLNGAGNGGLTVNLNVQAANATGKLYNVVAVRPAKEVSSNAPIIIIGGHYDSVAAGPGANDNGSGTAIVMELARLLADKYPKYELRFIAFGGEEIGLVGSADYVQKMSNAEISRVKAMINVDQVAVGRTLYLGGDQNLTKTAFNSAKSEGAGDVQPLPAGLAGASDHFNFTQVNIPVLFLNRGDDPDYHRPTDTADKVRPELLGLAGRIVISVIDAVTGS